LSVPAAHDDPGGAAGEKITEICDILDSSVCLGQFSDRGVAAMKIAVMSDLHLEFDARYADHPEQGKQSQNALDFYLNPPQPEADLLVLAGDIHHGPLAVDWVIRHFSVPAIMIGGNHEPYGHELFRTIAFNRQRAAATGGRVVFLERASWVHQTAAGERLRLIGATLWTDFQLYGTPTESMEIAEQRLDDFRLINVERGYQLRPLLAADTVRLHRVSVNFLRDELSRPFDGPTVVITHHAPSPRSIAPAFRDDPLNPAFVSDLEAIIRTFQPPLWVHGHVHNSFDYRIGRTRIVCNPRGYSPDQLNSAFDPCFVAEVQGSRPAAARRPKLTLSRRPT
jgi:Icc-related predicted phosphoesterase